MAAAVANERAAIVADLREQARIFAVITRDHARAIDLMADRIEASGAGAKEPR